MCDESDEAEDDGQDDWDDNGDLITWLTFAFHRSTNGWQGGHLRGVGSCHQKAALRRFASSRDTFGSVASRLRWIVVDVG